MHLCDADVTVWRQLSDDGLDAGGGWDCFPLHAAVAVASGRLYLFRLLRSPRGGAAVHCVSATDPSLVRSGLGMGRGLEGRAHPRAEILAPGDTTGIWSGR